MLPLRTARTTLLTLFVSAALAAQACGDERVGAAADSDAGDRADSDAGSGDGTCDRFCVWDKLMERGRRSVYASCICNQTSSATEPIQEGQVEICRASYVQTSQLEYEADCVSAMSDEQIMEIEMSLACAEPTLQALLPCLDGLNAGDACGQCEPLDRPEGTVDPCPVSYETAIFTRRCTDGRPGF